MTTMTKAALDRAFMLGELTTAKGTFVRIDRAHGIRYYSAPKGIVELAGFVRGKYGRRFFYVTLVDDAGAPVRL